MKFLVCLALLAFSGLSLAQVDRDVVDLNDKIRSLVLSNSYDQRTLLRAKNQLETVLLTLGGTDTGPVGGVTLRCVSRDNDNAAPYIFAVELSDFTLKRFPEHKFSSLNSCQTKAAAGRVMIGGFFTCVSRDGDDANPFVIASFIGEQTTKRTEKFSSLEQCQSTVRGARSNLDAFVMCVSRDNDGANPWIKVVVKRDGSTIRQTDTYSSAQQCQQSK